MPTTLFGARAHCSRIHRLPCRHPMSMSSFASHSPWFPETSRITPYRLDLETRRRHFPTGCRRNQLQMQGSFLLNLFINAMEAMDGQIGKPRILTISSSRADAGVVIRVQDTGPGIASEEAEQIFTPFHTTKKDGTGVGLTICQSIVSAHAGSLHVISGNAEGAAFEVVLPCSSARVSAEVEHPYPSSSTIPPSGALPQGG